MKQISKKVFANYLKSFLFSIAFILCAKKDIGQICSNPGSVIYSLSNSGNIYPITVSNASVGSVVNSTALGSTSSANAIGYNTENGIFYYFQNANSGSQQFVSYNPATSTYTTLASSPITSGVNRGCVNFNGTGYYCLDSNGNLCYYDIATNTWTLITSAFTDQYGNNVTSTFQSESSGDMAIDALGNLWIVASSSSKWGLYKIPAPLPTASSANITAQQLIAPSTATLSGANFVGIAFDPAGNIYMATNNDLYILQSNYTLTHLGTFSASGVCGDLTSCNYPFAILAVTFENFTATAENNNAVSLEWTVAQQTSTKGFYIESSVDGSNWNELGFIESNDAVISDAKYSFVDNNPHNGNNYYRIHEIDVNGAANYSVVKIVNFDNNSSNQTNVWPNPAKDVIKIQNNGNYVIATIYNQSGSMVSETKLQSGTNSINVNSLPFGAYIVNVKEQNGQGFNQKFIKE